MSRQDEIKKLIKIHSRHLQILKEQKAAFGLYTPPYIIIEIENQTEKIEELQTELASISNGVQIESMEALLDPTSIKKLLTILTQLSSGIDEDRIRAAELLSERRDAAIIPFLEQQLLREPNPSVRYWLARYIGETGGNLAKQSLLRLQNQLSNIADPHTLLGFKEALEMIDSKGQ